MVELGIGQRSGEHRELGWTQRYHTTLGRLILGAAVTGSLLAGCSGLGLSQDQAITAAKATAQGVSGTPVSFAFAISERFGDLRPPEASGVIDPNHLVWAVVFRGTFSGTCGGLTPRPHPCPAPNTTIRVVIDHNSGAILIAESPGVPH
jgi:hypothetical protein